MVKIPAKNARGPAAWLRRAAVWTVAAAGAAVLATGGAALASATPSVSGQIAASAAAQHFDPQPNFTKRN
jgi:hypothetical protein